MAAFIAELDLIAWFCNFRDTLEDMLRDCLVCRWTTTKPVSVTGEEETDMCKPLEIAQEQETADRNVRKLLGVRQKDTQDVHGVHFHGDMEG